jgi:predicted phosphodiesterase
VTYPLTALISDLHSNLPALTTALRDARERGAERFVCLGDVIGYGARPTECLELVIEAIAGADGRKPGLCLQGNHEYAVLSSGEDFNPNARRAIDWTRDQINQGGVSGERALAYWDFLGGLEPFAVEPGAMYAHGSPRDPVREYMLPRDIARHAKMQANFDRMRALDPDGHSGVCFVGHSHVPGHFLRGRALLPAEGHRGSLRPGRSLATLSRDRQRRFGRSAARRRPRGSPTCCSTAAA